MSTTDGGKSNIKGLIKRWWRGDYHSTHILGILKLSIKKIPLKIIIYRITKALLVIHFNSVCPYFILFRL